VPGGPCDRDLDWVRIEIGDTILRVDGKEYDFVLALVGDDVGSKITLTIQKSDSSTHSFDCVVERAALYAKVGKQLIADIEVDK